MNPHLANGAREETCARDPKRYLWLLALLGPCVPALAIGAYFYRGGEPASLLLPLLYVYGFVPLADRLLAEDGHNPPQATLAALCRDPYYRRLLYADLGLLYASFAWSAWFVGSRDLPLWSLIAFGMGVGLSSIDCIMLGHELGHKSDRAARVTAQIALALVGYGHFRFEHNFGHHVHVATPADSASARMGESVYRFALREMPGALRRGCSLQRQKLALHGRAWWSGENEILWSWALSATIAIASVAAFGPKLLLFLCVHHAQAWFGMTQANYIEHYGLLRRTLANGHYEPPGPQHSWNTNHIYSNLILFHLQRHSDHHAHARRPYQALRDYPELPRLPSGYPGCFALAAIPWLWFKVMDPKLWHWAEGDPSRINR